MGKRELFLTNNKSQKKKKTNKIQTLINTNLGKKTSLTNNNSKIKTILIITKKKNNNNYTYTSFLSTIFFNEEFLYKKFFSPKCGD